MANKLKNQWSYELFDSKENILSVDAFSKARYFTLFINDDMQGLFELPSKITSLEKQKLLKSQATKSLKTFEKIKKYKDEVEEIHKLFIEQLAIDKKLEVERKKQKAKEATLLRRTFKEEFKKTEPLEIISKYELPLNRIVRRYLKEGEVVSEDFKKGANRQTAEYKFLIQFDMKDRENELLRFGKEKLKESIEEFRINNPRQKILGYYIGIAINKFSDAEEVKWISTGIKTTSKASEVNDEFIRKIKSFNNDKENKEKYGDMFKDETMSIHKMEISIIWKK